jgi:hypothetical protein
VRVIAHDARTPSTVLVPRLQGWRAEVNHMRLVAICALSVIGLVVVACEKDSPPPMTPAAGTTQAVDKAVNDLANARCDREQRCNHIGQNATYSDRNHCMSVMGGEAREDLDDCTRGIDQEDMRECLTEIQNQDCSNVFDTFDKYMSCSMDDMCAD